MSDASEWVEQRIGRKLTPEQVRCVDTSCAIAAPHNLPLKGAGWTEVEWHPNSMCIVTRAGLMGSLATYDGDQLTQLVIRAHQNLVRVDLAPHSFQYLKIWFHARKSEGSQMTRHLSLHHLAVKAMNLADHQVVV